MISLTDLIPTVAGRAFYCTDRFAAPDEVVTAEEPVPGHARLWVVRAGDGRRYVCALERLCDVPPRRLYRGLLDAIDAG